MSVENYICLEVSNQFTPEDNLRRNTILSISCRSTHYYNCYCISGVSRGVGVVSFLFYSNKYLVTAHNNSPQISCFLFIFSRHYGFDRGSSSLLNEVEMFFKNSSSIILVLEHFVYGLKLVMLQTSLLE